MKKVQRLLSMTDGDDRKHVLDYTYVDLHYAEDQRKNLLNKFNSLNQELNLKNESQRDEISNLKKVIKKWTSSKVTLDQLLTEQVPGNIFHAFGGRGKKKDIISSKKEPLPPLRKLLGARPNENSKDDISLADLTLTSTVSDEIKKVSDKRLAVKLLKKKSQPVTSSVPDLPLSKRADSSTKRLLLTLMEEVKGLKEQIKIPSDTSLSISQSGSSMFAKGKQRT
ncbi:hypothetical protein Tco_0871449 [Tanacetum coccineum]